MQEPRVVIAPNAGHFTLDGTRTFVFGRSRVVILDPGPDDPAHIERLAQVAGDAEEGLILLTHGHTDHAAGVEPLARATGFSVAGNVPGVDRSLSDGDRVPLDEGWLEVIETPGHAERHLAFLHRPAGDLFVGDLLLGEGETTWVGEYATCVADYLHSLERVEALRPNRIFPAHGPVLERPLEAVAAFRAHRERRIREVERAARSVASDPGAWAEDDGTLLSALLDRVYGRELDPSARTGASWSVRAVLEYLGLAPFPPKGPPTGDGKRLSGSTE